MVEDLHVVLRASAAVSPHVAPLYLVVLRDIDSGHFFTYASLTLKIATVYCDEKPLARLSSPPPPPSGGGGAREKSPFSAHAFRRELIKPVGEWKAVRSARYLVWEGTGHPCVTCFRLFAVTDAHLKTDGFCPFSCSAAFAPGKAPPSAKPPPAKPPSTADWPPPAAPALHIAQLQPAPTEQGTVPPQATPPAGVAMSIRPWLPGLQVNHANPADFPPVDNADEPALPSSFTLAEFAEDDETWPAFRSGPIYIPPTAVNDAAGPSTSRAPPSGGAP